MNKKADLKIVMEIILVILVLLILFVVGQKIRGWFF